MHSSILFLDFETRSVLNVADVGAHRYATDPTTEVTLLSYAFGSKPVRTCTSVSDEVREALEDQSVLKVAHNAEFDMAIAKYVCGVEINPMDWWDTAYQAAYFGYPRKLSHLAEILRTTRKASQEEMLLFASPVRTKRKEIVMEDGHVKFPEPKDYPEAFERFKEYSALDVEVMRECYNKMAAIPPIEIFTMQFTFEMNFNGVPFDMEFARRVGALAEYYSTRAGIAAREKYGIQNLRSPKQVQMALYREGITLSSLNKKAREGITHEILELRDEATGSSFSKIKKAETRICPDGRLRGEFVGFGAHTGRWSSRGVQLQNFAHGADDASTDLSKVRSYDHLRQHLRLCIYAGDERNQFTCADLSQIEARIVAWLANCKWRMDAFRNDEDIYSRSAEKMFNIENVHKGMPERQMGKCAELGLGYGGGSAAIERIAPDFYREQGDEKVSNLVAVWRGANPEICRLWRDIENTFKSAMRSGIAVLQCGQAKLTFKYDGKTAAITLPSGRCLYYRGTHLDQGAIHYLDYSRGGEHAVRTKMWGGTLLENVTQAIARDVLVDIMQRVRARIDVQCVGSVHDEVWYISRKGENTLDVLLEEMVRPIDWAPGLVTKGDGFTDFRYIK